MKCRGRSTDAQWRAAASALRRMHRMRAVPLVVATGDTAYRFVVLMLIPPGCSALFSGIRSNPMPTCQSAIRRGPCLVPAIRMGGGNGKVLPVRHARLWFFGSIFVEWSESLGRHVVDCAATKARSRPAPAIP